MVPVRRVEPRAARRARPGVDGIVGGGGDGQRDRAARVREGVGVAGEARRGGDGERGDVARKRAVAEQRVGARRHERLLVHVVPEQDFRRAEDERIGGHAVVPRRVEADLPRAGEVEGADGDGERAAEADLEHAVGDERETRRIGGGVENRADVARPRDGGGGHAVQRHVREHHVHLVRAGRPVEREVAAPQDDGPHLVDAAELRADDDLRGIGRGDEVARRAGLGAAEAPHADRRANGRLRIAQHQRHVRRVAERAVAVGREHGARVDVGRARPVAEVVRPKMHEPLAHGDAAVEGSDVAGCVAIDRGRHRAGLHDCQAPRTCLEQTGTAEGGFRDGLHEGLEPQGVARPHVHLRERSVAVEAVVDYQRAPRVRTQTDERHARAERVDEPVGRRVRADVEADGCRDIRG